MKITFLRHKTAHSMTRMRKNHFTLIELMVVIAIIAILAGLLFPAFNKAKQKAVSSSCVSRLRGLGTAINAYLGDYKGYLPIAAEMPSLSLNDDPPISEALADYVDTQQAFLCPGDIDKKFFLQEGSSYEYNSMLGGRQLSNRSYRTIILYDYETFHGKAGAPGAKNYLFADGHVGDL